jgi:hypothetical protein
VIQDSQTKKLLSCVITSIDRFIKEKCEELEVCTLIHIRSLLIRLGVTLITETGLTSEKTLIVVEMLNTQCGLQSQFLDDEKDFQDASICKLKEAEENLEIEKDDHTSPLRKARIRKAQTHLDEVTANAYSPHPELDAATESNQHYKEEANVLLSIIEGIDTTGNDFLSEFIAKLKAIIQMQREKIKYERRQAITRDAEEASQQYHHQFVMTDAYANLSDSEDEDDVGPAFACAQSHPSARVQIPQAVRGTETVLVSIPLIADNIVKMPVANITPKKVLRLIKNITNDVIPLFKGDWDKLELLFMALGQVYEYWEEKFGKGSDVMNRLNELLMMHPGIAEHGSVQNWLGYEPLHEEATGYPDDYEGPRTRPTTPVSDTE